MAKKKLFESEKPTRKPPPDEVGSALDGKPDPLEVVEKIKRETPDILFRMELAKPLREYTPAAVMDRLDELCGVGGWDMDIDETEDNYKVRLTIRVPDKNGVTYPVARTSLRTRIGNAVVEAACGGWGMGGRAAFAKSPLSQDGGVPTVATPKAEAPRAADTPPPPPPPPMAKPEETQEEAVTRWVVKITACENAAMLNAMLPEMKKEKKEYQDAIWVCVRDTARQVGWLWDSKSKAFYTNPDGDDEPVGTVQW